MQFDKEFGFDVEYHNFCGFDKIHILEGHFGANQQFTKVGRFCGPRPGQIGDRRPWDGRRQIFDDTGNMEFWDIPFVFNGHKSGYHTAPSYLTITVHLRQNEHRCRLVDAEPFITYLASFHQSKTIKS